MSVCLSVDLFISLPACLHSCLSVCLSVCLFISILAHLCVSLSVFLDLGLYVVTCLSSPWLSLYLSTCLPICHSVNPFVPVHDRSLVFLSICLSVLVASMSICLQACMSSWLLVYLSLYRLQYVCLSVWVCPSFNLSVCLLYHHPEYLSTVAVRLFVCLSAGLYACL